ncbi:hypothetical protein GCM10009193_11660 [Shewanella aestuarii]|nr:hypothetical protein GCM10009193_11660 [Shewanella aestuarii]
MLTNQDKAQLVPKLFYKTKTTTYNKLVRIKHLGSVRGHSQNCPKINKVSERTLYFCHIEYSGVDENE